jgi:hypothetical protein
MDRGLVASLVCAVVWFGFFAMVWISCFGW